MPKSDCEFSYQGEKCTSREQSDICTVCKQCIKHCPGHFNLMDHLRTGVLVEYSMKGDIEKE